MSSSAARARSKQVDYSDFYSPEDAKKRKKTTDSTEDFSDDDDDVTPPKRSKHSKPSALPHKKKASAKELVAKAKKSVSALAASRNGKKTKKRALASSDSDSDSSVQPAKTKKPRDGATDRSASDKSTAKKTKALAEPKSRASTKQSFAREKSRETDSATNGSSLKAAKPALVSSSASVGVSTNDAEVFRKKYEALRQLRMTESEQLLQEAKELALEEKKTYERIITKLKQEVTMLSKQFQETESKHEQALKKLEREHQTKVDALERRSAETSDDTSRRRIKELETQLSEARRLAHSTGKSSRSGSKAVEETIQLAQATKLLEIYRLVTSTDIRLIETLDTDDGDDASYTDVTCATTDSDTGKQFHFDLGVPRNDDDEIEYLPSETPNRDFQVPSYLQDELSFKRPEMTKFMRTILDVVIRKKAVDGRSGR